MISESNVRKWHRANGLILVPLLFLQALSGIVVAFETLLGFHENVTTLLNAKETHALHYAWEYILLDIHFGGGLFGDLYHIVLVLGIFSLIMSGAAIYLFSRARQKNRPNNTL